MKKVFAAVLNTFLISQIVLGSFMIFADSAEASVATNIVISEVQLRDSVDTDNEFVELYNPTANPIDLGTLPLKLHIRNSSGTDANRVITFINNIIPSNGFFLIAPVGAYATSIGTDATYSTSGNMLVNNGGVYISTSITAATGVVDMLGFGTQPADGYEGTVYPTNPTSDNSVERKANVSSTSDSMNGVDTTKGNAWDTDDNSLDFADNSPSEPQNSASAIEDITAPTFSVTVTPNPAKAGMAKLKVVSFEALREAGLGIDLSAIITQNQSGVSETPIFVDKGNLSYEAEFEIRTGFDGPATVEVIGFDLAGNQGTEAMTFSVDTAKPNAPQNLKAVSGNQEVRLSWDTSFDTSPSSGVAGYNLYRNGAKINAVSIQATFFIDSNLVNGTDYKYQVSAVDNVGNESEKSTEITAAPQNIVYVSSEVSDNVITQASEVTKKEIVPQKKAEVKGEEVIPQEEKIQEPLKEIPAPSNKYRIVWSLAAILVLTGVGGCLYYLQNPKAVLSVLNEVLGKFKK